MKRVEINELNFKRLITGVASAVSKNDARRILQFVKLVVKKDGVTLYSVDGFRAARVSLMQDNKDEFECFFKLFSFKPTKNGWETVIVDYDEENKIAYITTKTEYGDMSYSFAQPHKFPDMDKIFKQNAEKLDRNNYVRADYIAPAIKAAASTEITGKVCIKTSSDKTNAIYITSKSEKMTNEQLVLPVRVEEEF